MNFKARCLLNNEHNASFALTDKETGEWYTLYRRDLNTLKYLATVTTGEAHRIITTGICTKCHFKLTMNVYGTEMSR